LHGLFWSAKLENLDATGNKETLLDVLLRMQRQGDSHFPLYPPKIDEAMPWNRDRAPALGYR
jgi:hypothetical protein